MELHVLDGRASGVLHGHVAAGGDLVGAVQDLSAVSLDELQGLVEALDDRGGVGAAVGGEGFF
ncbi:hypothetical protein GCM10010260_54070 [Streptomyces filipinensis]|uniref:Uncharacterized protein n=1 Tax=Streptomyces filipinensis TaxID=66887 RepID=A0A918MDW0_9ACTN|nr:hypothetical protein [Streptomyces filipinensis]GGV09102.1 hypothetical protein GCM10010260_54070 [Streptomyces filipinensis]